MMKTGFPISKKFIYGSKNESPKKGLNENLVLFSHFSKNIYCFLSNIH